MLSRWDMRQSHGATQCLSAHNPRLERARGVFPYAIARFLVESTIGPGVTLLHHPGIDVLVTEEHHRNQELVAVPVDDSQRNGSVPAGEVVRGLSSPRRRLTELTLAHRCSRGAPARDPRSIEP